MDPPPVPRHAGQDAANVSSSQESAVQPTQQPTQATQQATSQPEYTIDPDTWGTLIPYQSPNADRIVFQRWKRTYQVGRSPTKAHKNDVVLNGLMISGAKHCTITWDGVTGPNPSITVCDHSSNGTFINGELIGKSRTALLRDGNELSFGTWLSQDTEDGSKAEFRYIYRHAAYSRPTHGFYQHYDLHDELGKGTFATVMKALRREDGQWYAVKIIDLNKLRKDWSHVLSETLDVDDISREIGILQRLQHLNICELKDFYLQGTSLSLILEWVPGGDLLHYLLGKYTQSDRMSERDAKYLTYQICKALAYVHSQGIAHRDLKPENVLLTNDDPPIVKVADFGLAKAIDGESILKTICGTPVYLAPEVITQGPQGYSQLVDSWSVGVIVFSMLTMAMPFPEDTKSNIQYLIANRAPQWGVLYSCGVSAEAEDFLRGLLENDPHKRMNMADACVHRWLAEEVERDLNIVHAPHLPVHHTPAAHHPTNPVSAATSSTISDVEPVALSFRRIESYSSVPGLQHGREPVESSRSRTPTLEEVQASAGDDAGQDRGRPGRLTKRTASSAFSSASSLDSLEVAPVAASSSTPRAALPPGVSGVGAGPASQGARGRPPPAKRVRVEAGGRSSSGES